MVHFDQNLNSDEARRLLVVHPLERKFTTWVRVWYTCQGISVMEWYRHPEPFGSFSNIRSTVGILHCHNYRTISLISHRSKVMIRMILKPSRTDFGRGTSRLQITEEYCWADIQLTAVGWKVFGTPEGAFFIVSSSSRKHSIGSDMMACGES